MKSTKRNKSTVDGGCSILPTMWLAPREQPRRYDGPFRQVEGVRSGISSTSTTAGHSLSRSPRFRFLWLTRCITQWGELLVTPQILILNTSSSNNNNLRNSNNTQATPPGLLRNQELPIRTPILRINGPPTARLNSRICLPARMLGIMPLPGSKHPPWVPLETLVWPDCPLR